jgi:hypothetical protein
MARHVPLGQPDGVAFLATDGDFLSDKRDDRAPAFVIHDDELQQGCTSQEVYRRTPQG